MIFDTIKITGEVDNFLREKLKERLSQLTAPQYEFFKKLYPGIISYEDLFGAIDVCDRTIRKKEKL